MGKNLVNWVVFVPITLFALTISLVKFDELLLDYFLRAKRIYQSIDKSCQKFVLFFNRASSSEESCVWSHIGTKPKWLICRELFQMIFFEIFASKLNDIWGKVSKTRKMIRIILATSPSRHRDANLWFLIIMNKNRLNLIWKSIELDLSLVRLCGENISEH